MEQSCIAPSADQYSPLMEQCCLLPHTLGGLFGLIEVEGSVFRVKVKGRSTEGKGSSAFFCVWNSFLSPPFFARVQLYYKEV